MKAGTFELGACMTASPPWWWIHPHRLAQRGGCFKSAHEGSKKEPPKDAPEASEVFHKRDQGEALLNLENKAILATKTGDLRDPFVVSERPGVMASPCCALAHIRKAS